MWRCENHTIHAEVAWSERWWFGYVQELAAPVPDVREAVTGTLRFVLPFNGSRSYGADRTLRYDSKCFNRCNMFKHNKIRCMKKNHTQKFDTKW